MTKYQQDALTAMYKTLEFLETNNLPSDDVEEAIKWLETHYGDKNENR